MNFTYIDLSRIMTNKKGLKKRLLYASHLLIQEVLKIIK